MDFHSMRLLFALLALAANIATIGIVVIGFAGRIGPSGLALRRRVFGAFRGLELWLGFGVATTAMLGSLYLSMYPLVVILGIAAFRRDQGIRIYAASLAGIGAVIAIYHRIVQAFPELNGSACSAGVPCTAAYFTLFGFVTIPYMALSGFLLILALLYVDRTNSAA